jgi:hypothetical protein
MVVGIASQGNMEIMEELHSKHSLELLGQHAGCERHVGVLTALSGPLAR